MSDDGINMSAFPHPEVRDANGFGIREGSDGMMLRDWFAGQALVGILSNEGWSSGIEGNAYAIADAMLAARQESAS